MPLITLNYSFGPEGKDIARSVAQSLGMALYDDEKLKTIMKRSDQQKVYGYDFNCQAPGF